MYEYSDRLSILLLIVSIKSRSLIQFLGLKWLEHLLELLEIQIFMTSALLLQFWGRNFFYGG